MQTITLKDILEKCWTLIKEIYMEGKICSERHLQSEIFHILKQDNNFNAEYKIFIEPTIYSDKKEMDDSLIIGIIPDILITNHQDKIVCVFELKYKPNGYVRYKKDINNFGKFNDLKGSEFPIYLETNPKNGDWDYKRPFKIDKNILFAYAIIANEYSDALKKTEEIWKNTEFLKQPITNYIQLIGSVNDRDTIFSKYPC